MKLYDIIFISYSESNSDKNWLALKKRFPRAKRVHGVSGIKEAHQVAAQKSNTEFFFTVDADNVILPSFTFDDLSFEPQKDTLYVWRCKNPTNGLVYGYGAIKLYNKHLLQFDKNYVDLATTVSQKYKVIDIIASETHFHSTPFEAWCGAFRECAKLATTTFEKEDPASIKRLQTWCEHTLDVENNEWVEQGAKQGKHFANQVFKGRDILTRINDYQWLLNEFRKYEHSNTI